jgi:hypothetical protein
MIIEWEGGREGGSSYFKGNYIHSNYVVGPPTVWRVLFVREKSIPNCDRKLFFWGGFHQNHVYRLHTFKSFLRKSF